MKKIFTASVLFLMTVTSIARGVDSTFTDYQNYNHGYCPECSCYPCRCAPSPNGSCETGTCPDDYYDPNTEYYDDPNASCDSVEPCDPCNEVCVGQPCYDPADPNAPGQGTTYGISVTAIGVAVAAVAAAAAIILSAGNGASTSH